jgi:ApaG protein
MPQKISNGYIVTVESEYLPHESSPKQQQFIFAYHILIANQSGDKARLLNRHWIITDGWGRVEEVKGPGVIGKNPTFTPGDTFEYSSFCPLATSTGTMRGTYEMIRDDGTRFEIDVPLFFLYDPGSMN